MLLVDGVPIIGKDKLEKLLAKICKEFSRKGVTIKPDDIHVPWDDSTGKSKGCVCNPKTFFPATFSHLRLRNSFIFVELRSVDEANLALVSLHNHPFDARHIFKLNRFTDIEKFAELDEVYVEPEEEEFAPKVSLCFQGSILW